MEVDQSEIITDKEKMQLNIGRWSLIASIIALLFSIFVIFTLLQF